MRVCCVVLQQAKGVIELKKQQLADAQLWRKQQEEYEVRRSWASAVMSDRCSDRCRPGLPSHAHATIMPELQDTCLPSCITSLGAGCVVFGGHISHATVCDVMQVLRHKIMKLPSRAETEAELQKVQSEIANIQQDIASHQHTYEVGASVPSVTYLNMQPKLTWLYQGFQSRCMCVH